MASKRALILDKLKNKYSVETSSVKEVEEDSEYQAGELAGKLFSRKR